MSTRASQENHIVIIGGGIIGCTSAYYLTCHPLFSTSNTHITLLEASTIAAGASGKAGGLIAKWAYPRELTEVSFKEHKKLALQHGGRERWGWREVSCGKWEGRAHGVVDDPSPGGYRSGDDTGGSYGHSLKEKTLCSAGTKSNTLAVLPEDLDWVDEAFTDVYEAMAGETAQVHPYEFTTSMLALARERGGERLDVVEGGKVVSIERVSSTASSNWSEENCDGGRAERVKSKSDRVAGVTYITTTAGSQSQSHTVNIPADKVLLAAGPWSSTLMPSLPITSTRAHSIIIELPTPLSPHVLFTTIHGVDSTEAGMSQSPEIYPRPQNRVYACGPGDDTPLPPLASLVHPSAASISTLREQVGSISAPLKEGRVEVEQACFMPNVQGGPVVGAVDTLHGLIVATGHTCWGICNAPGTAKAVAELMMEGTLGKEWKLSKLRPSRFLK